MCGFLTYWAGWLLDQFFQLSVAPVSSIVSHTPFFQLHARFMRAVCRALVLRVSRKKCSSAHSAANAVQQVTRSKWHAASDVQQMTRSKCSAASDAQQVTGSKWRAAHAARQATRSKCRAASDAQQMPRSICLQFKVDSERQIFWRNFSWQFDLLSEFLPEIC